MNDKGMEVPNNGGRQYKGI